MSQGNARRSGPDARLLPGNIQRPVLGDDLRLNTERKAVDWHPSWAGQDVTLLIYLNKNLAELRRQLNDCPILQSILH